MSDRPIARVADQSGTGHDTQSGFGVVELLMATIVLALVMIGFAAIFGSAARESAASSNRTVAQQVATSEIEKLRQMDYKNLGTSGGNPPGLVPAEKQVGDLTVKTKITFVNDPAPGSFATLKDYKAVRITVLVTRSGQVVAEQVTKIAPPGAPGLDEGAIKVNVIDKTTNAPIENATVNLAGGPSPGMSDKSDAAGEVVFAGLKPNDTVGNPYNITVTAPGYSTAPAFVPPLPNASVRVAAASVLPLSILMVKPVGVTVNVENKDTHSPFTAETAVAMHPDGPGMGQILVTGATATASSFGSAPVMPDTDYTFSAVRLLTPPTAGGWFSKAVSFHTPSDMTNPTALVVPTLEMEHYAQLRNLKVTVKRGTQTVPGALVKLEGGKADVSFMAPTDNAASVVFTVPADSSSVYTITASNPAVPSSTATINTTLPAGASVVPITIVVP